MFLQEKGRHTNAFHHKNPPLSHLTAVLQQCREGVVAPLCMQVQIYYACTECVHENVSVCLPSMEEPVCVCCVGTCVCMLHHKENPYKNSA